MLGVECAEGYGRARELITDGVPFFVSSWTDFRRVRVSVDGTSLFADIEDWAIGATMGI